MKRLLLLTFGYCILLTTAVAQAEMNITDSVMLDNFHKVDEGIYRSGQPDKAQFEQLEQYGMTEILNLRRHNDDNDEAKDTALTLYHIKMRAEAMSETHLLNALRIIKNRKGNMLIHCHHGSDRTGGVVAMYRIVYQGWTKEAAIKELKEGGYGFHGIFRNIPKLINKIDVEEFKKKLNE